MRRLAPIVSIALLALFVHGVAGAAPAGQESRPRWKQRIDEVIGGRPVGVAVFRDGVQIYGHDDRRLRIPASNQKLLLSMPLLEAVTPEHPFETVIAASVPAAPVLRSDLWILGTGDPTLTAGGRWGRDLPFRPTRIGLLARKIVRTGITRIRGSVIGSTAYFARDWFAPGWKASFPAEEVPLPSALTYEGNVVRGRHISDPELRAARALTRRLEDAGVAVAGRPAAAVPGTDVSRVIAAARSVPVASLLAYTNRESSNFFAEVLGKALGVQIYGVPGTIASGARAIEEWAAAAGATVDSYDSSGLSYANRISPRSMAHLLVVGDDSAWGDALRRTLPEAGQGTLDERLEGIKVRAKTGTLDEISTLSGFVRLERDDGWAVFSIMSGGLSKTTAVDIEDAIVRILARRAL